MDWTNDQERAITTTDKNVLVAAAAGSGKTAVLVERIIRLILAKNISVQSMLVVTFTEAAASEMKAKIEKEIRKKIDELTGKGDIEQARKFKSELDKLPSANVSTFHSFAMDVIHRFFYKINLEPNLVTLEDKKVKMMKEEVLNNVFKKRYEKKDKAFIDFMDRYSAQTNDLGVKSDVTSLYDMLASFAEPNEWLEMAIENIDVDEGSIKEKEYYINIFRNAESECESLLKELEEMNKYYLDEGHTNAAKYLKLLIDILSNLKSYISKRDHSGVRDYLSEVKYESCKKEYYGVPQGSSLTDNDVKESLGSIKGKVKEFTDSLGKKYFAEPLSQIVKDISDTKPLAMELVAIVKDYMEAYQAEKLKISAMDFNDMERYAYEILKDESVQAYYRDRFKYIFIDEYQDTSVIQEAIISKVAGKDNLFMVGDVKQSIYGFRNTSPEYFVKRYKEYAEQEKKLGDESNSIKIDLNKNFRSKQKVIDYVNSIFKKAMDGYDEDAELHVGASGADNVNQGTECLLTANDWSDISSLDESLIEYKRTEREALIAVERIKEYLGTEIYDSRNDVTRKISPKDIVILLRANKNKADVFAKVLRDNNIECFIEENEGLLDTTEVSTLISILSLIDNESRDIDLLAVMRSLIFDFTIDDLIQIRVNDKEDSYIDAVRKMAESNSELGLKCKELLDFISEYREKAKTLPIDMLIWEILIKKKLYVSCGLMPAGAQRQANLRLIVDKAEELKKSGFTSLYEFLAYLKKISEGEISLGQAKIASKDEDVVRIMTIHKSKGLEFPIVILGAIDRQIMSLSAKETAGIIFHKDLGIAMPTVNAEEGWKKENFFKQVIKDRIHLDNIEEEKRILYVALTRACDRLILIGTTESVKDGKCDEISKGNSSFLKMIGYDLKDYAEHHSIVTDDMLSRVHKAKAFSAAAIRSELEKEPGEVDSNVQKIMDYKYDLKGQTVKSKYTVSELNHSESAERPDLEKLSNKPSRAGKEKLKANEIGTINHKAFELLDIAIARKEGMPYVDSFVESLISDEFMTKDEASYINKEGLLSFANSRMGERISKSKEVRREESFVLSINEEGVDTLVQGTIDCFFIEEDGAVLIDYKATNEDRDDVLKQRYEVQIKLYKEAIEEATHIKVKEAYLYLVNQAKLIKF